MVDYSQFIDLILATNNNPNLTCTKVQVVTHGLGAGEVLAGLASDATLPDKVSYVTNMTPCVIPTYIIKGDDDDSGSSKHGMLAEKQSPGEPPREL